MATRDGGDGGGGGGGGGGKRGDEEELGQRLGELQMKMGRQTGKASKSRQFKAVQKRESSLAKRDAQRQSATAANGVAGGYGSGSDGYY